MKKTIIAILATLAFSNIVGMQDNKVKPTSDTQPVKRLNCNNILKGLLGLAGTAACGYLTWKALFADNKLYSKFRKILEIKVIENYSAHYKHGSKTSMTFIRAPKNICAIVPAFAMYLSAKYSFNQFNKAYQPK